MKPAKGERPEQPEQPQPEEVEVQGGQVDRMISRLAIPASSMAIEQSGQKWSCPNSTSVAPLAFSPAASIAMTSACPC